MADRTIIMGQNGRHGLRGVSARNPSEFEAYHETGDNLTYTVDMSAYLGTDTISSVTRTPYGLTVSNASNTTTTLSQRLSGFGYVDIKVITAAGDSERFRIYIEQRVPTGLSQGVEDYIEVPVATTATRDPTTSDDSTANFVAGNLWINTTTLNQFTCIANTAGAARWRHTPRILAMSNTAVSAAADTAVNTLATYTLTANTMGANGEIVVEQYWTVNNNANAKTTRVSFGGTNIQGQALASSAAAIERTVIRNRTASTQIARPAAAGTGGFGATTASLSTASIDTTADVTVLITAQKGTAGDTMTLEGYTITLTRPDIA